MVGSGDAGISLFLRCLKLGQGFRDGTMKIVFDTMFIIVKWEGQIDILNIIKNDYLYRLIG